MGQRPSFQPDPVVDENNNEEQNENDLAGVVAPPRPRGRPHLATALTVIAVILISFGAEARVFNEKLEKVQTLAAQSKVGPWADRYKAQMQKQNPDICYDDGCLDAAYDLLHAVNLTVDPCTDFFEFSCGRWLFSNPVPPAASRWSRFNRLRDEVNNITQTILTSPQNINDPRPINQVKDFYNECISLDELEQVGLAPLSDLLIEFGRWPMLNPSQWNEGSFDWLVSLGELRRRLEVSAMISVYIERDLKDTSRNVIFIDQPGFGLPRGILIDAPSYPALITAYRTYIVEVAQELGSTESQTQLEAAAQGIIDLEIRLANLTQSDEERYDIEAIYKPYILPQFQARTDSELPGYSVEWGKLLRQVFNSSGVLLSPTEPLNVAGESYIFAALPVFRDASARVVADYVGWKAASSVIVETTQAMRDIAFKFNQALTGAREPQPRAMTCAGASNNNFGMAIGVKYIEAAFDNEAKDLVNELVDNLFVAFREMVNEAEWMEPETKVEALAKADTMISLMAFPDWLNNRTAIENYYAGVELVTGPAAHFRSVLSVSQWSGDKKLKSLRQPTTQDEWLTYPGVVNAFYSPPHNSITFPAGILQPPFFGKSRPKSQNYGGIGMVIGHEITHGFDNQGSQYDKNGNAENWWDELTKERYNNRTKCMADQYSKFYLPNVDMYVNGELTLGENIGDNGGIRESFKAYRRYVDQIGQEEGRLPGLEFLTGDQLFFVGYANIWCESITDEGLINQLLTDPHSPARYRVIGPVRNNLDFAEAYNCPVDPDGMNPPIEDKCTVW